MREALGALWREARLFLAILTIGLAVKLIPADGKTAVALRYLGDAVDNIN